MDETMQKQLTAVKILLEKNLEELREELREEYKFDAAQLQELKGRIGQQEAKLERINIWLEKQ